MNNPTFCPKCGTMVLKYSNPTPTADVVIYDEKRGIVLVRRSNEPLGLALPGGFVEEGESFEHAAVREMKEETSLDIELLGVLGIYSDPKRDMRQHTVTTVFVGRAVDPDKLCAGDDAAAAAFYPLNDLPGPLCFDHAKVIGHFMDWIAGRRPLLPCAEDPHIEYGVVPYTHPFQPC